VQVQVLFPAPSFLALFGGGLNVYSG